MEWSIVEGLAFFTCVVLHELGHSFTGQHFGVKVRRILLMPIGGMAQFDSIPRQPRQEILMTLAGPAVNFLLAGILWIFATFPDGWDAYPTPSSLGDLVRSLFVANIAMGVFNLAPVFPMDGGRILRALLAIRLPYVRATYVAVMIGKVLAVAAIIVALFFYHSIYLAILFGFIFMAGQGEYRAVKQQELREAHWREMLAQATARNLSPPPEPPILGP
jgi:Zn-dependent protease